MDKVTATAAEALADVTDVTDGQSFAVGGFGLSGVPEVLIAALRAGRAARRSCRTTAASTAVVSASCSPRAAGQVAAHTPLTTPREHAAGSNR